MAITGGCQCGALRYAVGALPSRVYCCHCTDCRAQSSSAFGIPVIVPPGALRVTKGTPRVWRRPTASGKVLACAFCPDCGSRVWHVNHPVGEEMSIKGGSIDGGVDLTGAFHIWTRSKPPGVCIPAGTTAFAEDHD